MDKQRQSDDNKPSDFEGEDSAHFRRIDHQESCIGNPVMFVCITGGTSPNVIKAITRIRELEDAIKEFSDEDFERERERCIFIGAQEDVETAELDASVKRILKCVLVSPSSSLPNIREVTPMFEYQDIPQTKGEKIQHYAQQRGKNWKRRNLKLTKTRNGWR